MRFEPGTRIGRYEILGGLGAGGMGEVYRAHDPRLDRTVAIKILLPHLAENPGATSRFEREARAVAALSHPNVLTVYDVGTHEGTGYVVTELLEGQTLRDHLARAPLSWKRASELGAAIAEGVAAAHARGLIHRDLKPENLFLTSDGGVKILDFGLAAFLSRPLLASRQDTPTVTQEGALLGTVGYMSPEQVRGESSGPPSDVFALGCVLHEMVTGTKAFQRDTAVQTLSAILESDPPAPSRSVGGVPPELDRLIGRCLEKDPARRLPSARDLSDALRELAARFPAPTAKSRRPYGWKLATGIMGVLALAGFVFVVTESLSERGDGTGTSQGEHRLETLAVLPFENLTGDDQQDFFADGMTEAITTKLGELTTLRVTARPAVMKFKGGNTPPAAIARELHVDVLVSGSVRKIGDQVQVAAQIIDPASERNIWSKSYERDLRDVLDLQNELSRAVASEVSTSPSQPVTEVRRTVQPDAYQDYLRARYLRVTGTTNESSEQAIRLLRHAIELDPNFAPAYAELARAYIDRQAQIVPEEASVLEQEAFAAVERALELDPNLAEAYIARGDLLWTHAHRFAHERAAREYRRALELNPSLDGAHRGLASIFAHVGFFEESLDHSDKALEHNPSNAIALHHRSEGLLWSGREEEALGVLTGIPKAVFPDLAAAHTAWALARLGRDDEARSRLHRARTEYPDDPSGVLSALEAVFLARSEPATARKRIERAVRRVGFNPSHHTKYFVGSAWAQMGRPDEAVAALREAAETGFPCLPLLESDPNLDPIRDDPDFGRLLADVQKQTKSLREALFGSQG